jgi:acyl carrier protein
VAGAGPAAHFDGQSEAQGGGGVAGGDSGRGSGAQGSRRKSFWGSADWLLALIAQITGETPVGVGDELRLSEDLQLDSLGRVQLAAALEERLGTAPQGGLLERAETLGELRALVAGEAEGTAGKAGIFG